MPAECESDLYVVDFQKGAEYPYDPEDFVPKDAVEKPVKPPSAAPLKRKAIQLARQNGWNNNRLSRELDIPRQRFQHWWCSDPMFKARLVVARDDWRICEVEDSIFKRSIGYDYEKKVHKVREIKDDEGNVVDSKLVLSKTITEHIPGEVSAMKEFLHNRAPDRWAAKNSEVPDGRQNITIQIVNYGSDTDPSSIQVLPQALPTALLASDASGKETGCIDLAPTNGQR